MNVSKISNMDYMISFSKFFIKNFDFFHRRCSQSFRPRRFRRPSANSRTWIASFKMRHWPRRYVATVPRTVNSAIRARYQLELSLSFVPPRRMLETDILTLMLKWDVSNVTHLTHSNC